MKNKIEMAILSRPANRDQASSGPLGVLYAPSPQKLDEIQENQMFSSIFFVKFPKIFKIFRKRPNASERIWTHPNASGRIRMHPNRSKQVREPRKTCEGTGELKQIAKNFKKN